MDFIGTKDKLMPTILNLVLQYQEKAEQLQRQSLSNDDALAPLADTLVQIEILQRTASMLETEDFQCHLLTVVKP